ncbi:MAG: [FeFe] hydrogenase H-cluster radical SAM maturase HydE [Candidatus Omnitrophota bacterium]|jgi:biotin synthase
MCYAIPGKVLDVDKKIITVDYFGEHKKARNEFYELTPGDYVYAQGGFVVQKISESEAIEILKTWEELFFKLQEIDSELVRNPKGLYQVANNIRHKNHGNSCCIHGILEFSNYCRCNCLYCGIRKDSPGVTRYRMSVDEVVDAARKAVHALKFKALVLQSGEDLWYDEKKLARIVKEMREKAPCLIILSIGERDLETYRKLYDAGARGALIRFETSNSALYKKIRPEHRLEDRLDLIRKLKEIGYIVMTGFLIGLPGQTEEDILKDIDVTDSLGPDMFSFGPFIPHPDTPLAQYPSPTTETVLNTIAHARIKSPQANILVNTSFETLDRENAVRLGLMAGANSVMINVTPQKYRKLYDIYPNRAGIDLEMHERIDAIVKTLHAIGRAPTDLGV